MIDADMNTQPTWLTASKHSPGKLLYRRAWIKTDGAVMPVPCPVRQLPLHG